VEVTELDEPMNWLVAKSKSFDFDPGWLNPFGVTENRSRGDKKCREDKSAAVELIRFHHFHSWRNILNPTTKSRKDCTQPAGRVELGQ